VLPNFLIVGAMKCGTSSMASYLGEHPAVYMVPGKELEFFDRLWENGLDWYRRQFAAGAGSSAIGEASPTYLGDGQALARIASVLPEAKLIVMLRNPVDRAYSHYWHWRLQMNETRTFAEAVADELDAGSPDSDPTPGPAGPPRSDYVGDGRYLSQLEVLCRHFPREQLLVLLLEDLEQRAVETFQTVCDFLDVDRGVVPESVGDVMNPHIGLNKTFHPAWLWKVLVRLQIGRVLPPRIGAAIWRSMVRFNSPYPPMSPSLRSRLTEYYAQENAALAEWLGRDLSSWSAAGETVTQS
jgi:Sulfotransferase domain